jgi:hypothetical protein
VYVPDYQVTVTPDNFYLLTETNSEKNFFPGSTQKKDFLRSLSNALMAKLASEKQFPYEKFAQMIVDATQQKDLLFAFSDPGVQNVFTVNDLSSSLWDDRQPENNTIFDYLGVVDANVGANKANYYIKRSLSQSVIVDDGGGLSETAEVTYQNTSTPTTPFGGDYKDYLRFVLPANATIESISFDNKPADITPAVTDPAVYTLPGFTPPPGLEVEQTEEQGKSVVGFFVIIPKGTTRTIAITYNTPDVLANDVVSFAYDVKLFKEPGTDNDSSQISLSYPNDVTAVGNDKRLTNVGGKLLYDGQLSEDTDFTAAFSRK